LAEAGTLRIRIVTAQLLGFDRVGGAGTATTFLALALARSDRNVDILYVGGGVADAPAGEWAALYDAAGIPVLTLAEDDGVEPRPFRKAAAVERALRADAPDVVIAHEFGAPAYTAQRLRSLGLGFERTSFVVLCHGTRRWVKEVTGNVDVSSELLLESALERASVELADVLVSPSAFMLGWMRGQGWSLPETARVIPYLTRTAATGASQPDPSAAHDRVERITYFGRLEEIKGIGPFVAGLNMVEPVLLRDVEIEFLGTPTKHWTRERVESLLQHTKRVTFQGGLDQREALERLRQPGTVAVMPSLADNSPNAVYECLDHGIPFLASDSGGIAELVAVEDHSRVLFEPTPAGVATALRRVLSSDAPLRAARPAFDGSVSLAAWDEVLKVTPTGVSVPSGPDTDWALVLADGDEPDPDMLETLIRAQVASGADAVTCGVRSGAGVTLFAGETGGLGVVGNHFGGAALVRPTLLAGDGRRVWPLLARLSARGLRIASVPLPLLSRAKNEAPDPVDALLAVEHAEQALPRELSSLARLVAGLTADAERQAG
jgi:glycosyltransferase involved in cell wall biosynthesis